MNPKGIDGFRECLYCKNKFAFRNSLLKRGSYSRPLKLNIGHKNQKYCSRKCSLLWRNYNQNPSNPEKVGGKNHYSWKGEEGSYGTKHTWLRSRYGNPPKCEECGKLGRKVGKIRFVWNIHWANIRGVYTRNRQDYKGLCYSCHHKLDGIGYKKGHSYYPPNQNRAILIKN